MTLPEKRHFGYLHGEEDLDFLSEQLDPEGILERAKASYPEFNPYATPWLNWQDQGNQGSCQGHSLSHAFQVCLVQEYALQVVFSRAAAYYISQDLTELKATAEVHFREDKKQRPAEFVSKKNGRIPRDIIQTNPRRRTENLISKCLVLSA